MNISYNSLEEKLICEGKLSQSQINEIRRVFNLLDTDKNGILSYQEMNQAVKNLSHDSFSPQEVQYFFQSMDFNKSGSIQWPEFLKVIGEWLQIFKDSSQALTDFEEDVLSPLKRRNFHDKLTLFFKQFKQNVDFGDHACNFEEIEDLEDRASHWNYSGNRVVISNNDKWSYYNNEASLLIDKFKIISQCLEEKESEKIVFGLRQVLEMLNISCLFTSPIERLQISQYLIKLFDFIDNSIIIKIIKYLHESGEPEIILESIRIITLYTSGPNLINLSKDSIFHPSLNLHKNFLIQNNMIEILLRFIERPPNNEIKLQSLLALGFLMKNSIQIRDLVILEKGVDTILKHYSPDTSVNEMEKITWNLSIIAGVSVKIRLKEAVEAKYLIEVFCELLFWKDDIEILVNSLLGLGYLLPFVTLNEAFIGDKKNSLPEIINAPEILNRLKSSEIFDDDNFKIYNRIMALLSHNSLLVKRASLFCINKLINDDSHCQLLIECKLIAKIIDLLIYNSPEIRNIALHLIQKMIEKGYSYWVFSEISLCKNLLDLLYTDDKQKVILVLLKAVSQKNAYINKILLQGGYFKGLIDNISNFKQYDNLIAEIYGYRDPIYDFTFLSNIFKILNFLLEHALENLIVDSEFISFLLKELNFITIEKLQKMLDSLFYDINYNRIDFFTIKTDGPDLGISIQSFLKYTLEIFSVLPQDFISMMPNNLIIYLLNVNKLFNENLHKLEEKIKYSNSNISGIQIDLNVKEEENLNNFQIISVSPRISLVELFLKIEHNFRISPINIFYIYPETQQKIKIENDEIWNKVIMKNGQDFEMKKTSFPQINLLINNPLKKGFRYYEENNEKTSQLFGYPMRNIVTYNMHTNLEKQQILLKDLKEATNLSFEDIENLYNSFIRVTRQRAQNKNDGSVTFQEFSIIMRDYFSNENFIKDIFQLLDFTKSNLVDFRDFVRLIGILKSDNLESKLKLCFKSYDINNKGYLDKTDVFKLLQANLSTSGFFYDSEEIQKMVNNIYEKVDLYHEGKLTYTAFKEAFARNYIFLSSLWLDPKEINLRNFVRDYFQENNYKDAIDQPLFLKRTNYV